MTQFWSCDSIIAMICKDVRITATEARTTAAGSILSVFKPWVDGLFEVIIAFEDLEDFKHRTPQNNPIK